MALGQFIIALNFAEVSSHFPVAGSVFQWTKYLAGSRYSWFTGWIYIFAGILTVTAVVVTLPLADAAHAQHHGLAPQPGSLHDQIWVAVITLVVITVLNIYSVKLVSIVNNTGVFFEIAGMVVFAVVMLDRPPPPVDLGRHPHRRHPPRLRSFTAAMFMSLFVIYGFDTASTLAEETNDPRRAAPKAVLSSVGGAFVIGGIFLLAMLMAIPNLHTAVTQGWGPVQIIEANFSKPWAILYFAIVSAAILVCCMCIMTATIRLCFGMSRDNRLPGSKALAKVHPTLHTPVWACIAVAVVAAIPLLQVHGAGDHRHRRDRDDLPLLLPRQPRHPRGPPARRWPKVKAPFSLGKWGSAASTCSGILYGGAMLLNFAGRAPPGTRTPAQTRHELRPQLSSTRCRSCTRRWARPPHRRALLLPVEALAALPVVVPAEDGRLRHPAGVAAARRGVVSADAAAR